MEAKETTVHPAIVEYVHTHVKKEYREQADDYLIEVNERIQQIFQAVIEKFRGSKKAQHSYNECRYPVDEDGFHLLQKLFNDLFNFEVLNPRYRNFKAWIEPLANQYDYFVSDPYDNNYKREHAFHPKIFPELASETTIEGKWKTENLFVDRRLDLFPTHFQPQEAFKRFWEERESSSFCDCTIIIVQNFNHDSTEFKAHKILLCRCPYFDKVFKGQSFKESQESIVTLEDVSANLFEHVLRFLYFQLFKPHDDLETLMNLHFLANRLGMRDLMEVCDYYIIQLLKGEVRDEIDVGIVISQEERITQDNFPSLARFAIDSNSSAVLILCLDFAEKSAENLKIFSSLIKAQDIPMLQSYVQGRYFKVQALLNNYIVSEEKSKEKESEENL